MSDPVLKLPTDEELSGLSFWAMVVLESRCARRVQPLVMRRRSESTDLLFLEVESAISWAESAARKGHASKNLSASSQRLGFAILESLKEVTDGNPNSVERRASNLACVAAQVAVQEAERDPEPNPSPDIVNPAENLNSARMAAQTAASAAEVASKPSGELVIAATRRDYQVLKWMGERYGWTDESPVDSDSLGPLWIMGQPIWWPEEKMSPSEPPPTLHLEFSIPDGVDKDEADRLVGEIIQRSNELHHAMGGNGLRFEDGCVYESEPALEPAGEPQDEGRWS